MTIIAHTTGLIAEAHL